MVYFGSTDHDLYAVDLETGARKWEFKTGSRVVSSPAVDQGAVYFGSYDGAFYAVDAATGQQKWKFKTGGERRFAAKHLHGSLPTRGDDARSFRLLSFLAGGELPGSCYFGSGDGNVYALNAADGSLKWKFTTGDVVHASPALADGTLYIGSWDSFFYAIDAATGKEKWRFKTGEDHDIHNQVGIQSSAAVADGVVYFGCRDSNFMLSTRRPASRNGPSTTRVPGSSPLPLYATAECTSQPPTPVCSMPSTPPPGSKSFSFDGKHWPMFSSPAIAGNTLYIGSHDGHVRALNISFRQTALGFRHRWRETTRRRIHEA